MTRIKYQLAMMLGLPNKSKDTPVIPVVTVAAEINLDPELSASANLLEEGATFTDTEMALILALRKQMGHRELTEQTAGPVDGVLKLYQDLTGGKLNFESMARYTEGAETNNCEVIMIRYHRP